MLTAVGESVILVEVAGAGDYANCSDILDQVTQEVLLKDYKCNTERRTLRLTKRAHEILKQRRESTWPRTYVFPAQNPAGLSRKVWATEDICRGYAAGAIQSAIKACGLNDDTTRDRVTPHTFRDTFASRLVQKGVSLLKVSLLLGHANPAMTQKYAHLCPDSTGREAVDILNSLHAD
ncbi:tyrosine-type recombinase/integrase [Burkholderia cepacia]|uniref:tyrosine-type recombinase/integrase n=1 Tax=Burkholderia cepacia TaxID=292 RepID=UPI00159150FE|nr:tyrosine-type recombinase/integrase [Burkholderia cepacia]